MDLSCRQPLHQLTHRVRVRFWLTFREVTPEYPNHRRTLQQREIERQLGDLAVGKAHYHVSPTPRN